MPQKVIVARYAGPEAQKILESEDYELITWPENSLAPREWLLENIKGASGIVCSSSEKVNAELLDAAGKNLKIVSTMSVGYDHVDTKELVKRGILLGYTPEVLDDAVADITVMLSLMATRHARVGMQVIDQSIWPTKPWEPFGFCGTQISSPSTVVGFFGFGRIAQSTLQRLVAFGVKKCVYHTRSPANHKQEGELKAQLGLDMLKRVELEGLATESDLIIILSPGGPSTYHAIDDAFLRKCKKTATIVNTARGTVVDSDALALALKEGRLWSAGLDVVEGEPNVDANHPLVKEPRCVIVPHIGSATWETRTAMATTAATNLVQGLAGKPLKFEAALRE